MERGPMALFGAIVAVGLGPALWLGTQLGVTNAPVGKPPVVIRQQVPAAETDQGGYGAGEVSDETTGPVIDFIPPAAAAKPTPRSASPRPATSTSSSPSPSASTSTTPSAEPSVAPSEPSAEPSVIESSEAPEIPVVSESAEPSTLAE